MVKRSRIVAFFLIVLLFAGLIGGTTDKVVKKINLGLDLRGGFEVLYKVEPVKKGQKIDKAALADTAAALDRRVNALGVSEPQISVEGNNRIRVQLAGVKDQNEARKMLSTTANLTFRDVNDKVMMDGTDLVQGKAKQSFDQNGKPDVVLQLKSRKKFANVTKKILAMAPNNQLVIWMDFQKGDSYKKEVAKKNPKFLSNPSVNSVLNTDQVEITGNFTVKEASNLADLLNAGALPVKLHEIYSTSVGASFGQEALHDTILAGIIGVAAIFLFMIGYYRFPGFVACITLSVYIFLILLVYRLMGAVLTLPGIAALVLGVGMAVDANIITYERIKEELRVGKSVKSAFRTGNKSSFVAIFDSNITTILAAIILFYFGTSSIRGFATTLIISILLSFLTAVYGSRWLLGLWVNSNFLKKRPHWFGVKKSAIHDIAENVDTHDLKTKFDWYDFVKHRNIFFAISAVLIIGGFILLSIFKLNLSIDFSSGTRIEVSSNHALSQQEIQRDLDHLHLKSEDIVMQGANRHHAVIRVKGSFSDKEKSTKINQYFTEKYGKSPSISSVSPTVGKELALSAMYSLLLAAVGIIIYVAFRFEWRMGVASIVALFHDAFFMIAFFSITRLEVDVTFIAAVLTIVGYSINDTIVTFDRIRDNLNRRRKIKTAKEIHDIVNAGIRQTLARSVNTVLTVLMTSVALAIFGSESIRNFSIALIVGLITGTYSSVFIAAQIWFVLKKRQLKKHGSILIQKARRTREDEPQV
ncbi:protein translocase subunit SecDF [Heyndrickxia coagulans]|uniref:Multifunctional fusion protein n=1 Tax=Heyndrickxia coagulans TaxID=1398 RepID=A0AAW7CJB7_HEYCO|nr:protein translocase subunit SecDF [Heyndrickxia coagulans]MDL5041152.1 protein translocase subunit SecDF [Heyndrickxia coagulans]